MASPIRFGFGFDVRNPKEWHKPFPEIYAEHLDFIAWADSIGFRQVWFAEHHGIDDGYMPSPLMFGAAVAARTKHVRISTGVGLLPFYHPVRFAEDMAVLDNLSNGRAEVAMGIGYLKKEAAAYDFDFKSRGRRSDEILQIVKRLWQGETVNFDGEFYKLSGARITPQPVQKPNIPLFVGGVAPPGVRRAARLGDGFSGQAVNYPLYLEEYRACGRDPALARYSSMDAADLWFFVTEDPEQTLHEVAPHCYYQINTYAEWQADEGWGLQRTDFETFKNSGAMRIFTPDEAIAYIRKKHEAAPFESFCMQAPAGFPLSKFTKYAELFANKVLPAFR